jgi:hypothetical protein
MSTISLTLILIILTVGISWYAWQNPSLFDKWVMNPVRVSKYNEYYRFITSGFIHADIGHLIFNMFSLYFFGEAMEMFLGQIFGSNGAFYYLALYIARDYCIRNSYFSETPQKQQLQIARSIGRRLSPFIRLYPLSSSSKSMPCTSRFVFQDLFLGLFTWPIRFMNPARWVVGSIMMLTIYGAIFGILFMAVLLPASVPNFLNKLPLGGCFKTFRIIPILTFHHFLLTNHE